MYLMLLVISVLSYSLFIKKGTLQHGILTMDNLGDIYSPWAILRGLQKFSGLFSYMERVFSAKMYSPNIYYKKKSKMNSLLDIIEEK